MFETRLLMILVMFGVFDSLPGSVHCDATVQVVAPSASPASPASSASGGKCYPDVWCGVVWITRPVAALSAASLPPPPVS